MNNKYHLFINKIIDKLVEIFVDFIYSKEKKIERYLLLLTGIGFILRLIAALHLDVLADDMVYASQSAGIISSGIISTHSNPPLFFYLTDLAYQFFGYTTLTSRFWPLLAGTLLIPLVFLVSKEFFNKNIALCAAFFATFSNFLIKTTFAEQSLVVLFFVFSGVFFGIVYLENKTLKWLALSATCLGLGLITKYNAPFFIFSFIVFSIWHMKNKKERIFTKKHIRHFILFLSILLFFATPFLSFNYFIYKEKGIVDIYFSRIFNLEKTQDFYGGLAGQENSFFNNILNYSNYGNYSLIYRSDTLIFLFGILGIFLSWKRKEKKFLYFFLIFLIIPFILQSAGAPLPKHFTFMFFLFCIPAGHSLLYFLEKVEKINIKTAGIVFISVVMLLNLGNNYSVPQSYLHNSATSSLKSFINNQVGDEDLIIFDSRIYTARSMWLATDKSFLNFQQFNDFYIYNEKINSSTKVTTNLYFIECAVDDCGWGWVKDDQALNISSEGFLEPIKNISFPVERVYDYSYDGNEITSKKEKREIYKIYLLKLSLNEELIQQVKLTQSFYFVPYLYLNMQNYPFSYETNGLQTIINKLSLAIIYLSILLTIALYIYLLFFLLGNNLNKNE